MIPNSRLPPPSLKATVGKPGSCDEAVPHMIVGICPGICQLAVPLCGLWMRLHP